MPIPDPEPFSPEHLRAVARRLRDLDDRLDELRASREYAAAAAAVDPLPVQRRDDLDAAALALSHPSRLLTFDEHSVLEDLGALAGRLVALVDVGPSRDGDVAELCHHVHALQNAVLAQAAARAYPSRYRLLGGEVVR
jgi:hypothetical protein